MPHATQNAPVETSVWGDRLLGSLTAKHSAIEGASVDVQAEHCVKWIERNCLIQDPTSAEPIPFELYPTQEEFVWLWLGEVDKARRAEPAGVRTEKTRQMGDSWHFMALELYTLRFWQNFRALNISRKQDRVDDGGQGSTPDSLHGKIRYMYDRLRRDAFKLDIRYLTLVNPVTGGTVLGEASTPNAGRSGTYLYGLWDETAFAEHSWSVLASWEQAVRCPHYLSTPCGQTNVFAHLAGSSSLVQVRHHWTMHPIKSQGSYRCEGGLTHEGQTEKCKGGEMRSPWYDEQCKRLTPELIAQELDISYERSVFGRAFPEFDVRLHAFKGMEKEPGGVWVATIDPGATTAAACLLQFVPLPGKISLRIMDAWEGHDATSHTYVDLLEQWKQKWELQRLFLVGDPSGWNRDLTDGRSVFGEMAKHGWRADAPNWLKNVGDRVRLCRDFMAGRETPKGTGEFAYDGSLETFAKRIVMAAWPTNTDGVVTSETDLAHNEGEHMADALSYGVAWYMGRETPKMPETPRASTARPYTAGLLDRSF